MLFSSCDLNSRDPKGPSSGRLSMLDGIHNKKGYVEQALLTAIYQVTKMAALENMYTDTIGLSKDTFDSS